VRALLLAAGFGSRLQPLTIHTPKCLMPIRGRPLLGIWLEQLIDAGVGPFLINTHYLFEKVEAFIETSPYKNKVKLMYEESLKGTAGTLIENKDFFGDEDLLLIHADNYYLGDLSQLIYAHQNRPQGCLMTMMTFTTDSPESCGIVEIDDYGVVIGFHEKVKDAPSNLANSAVYVISNELLKILSHNSAGCIDFSNDVIPRFLGNIYSYETQDLMIDIGTLVSYEKANRI